MPLFCIDKLDKIREREIKFNVVAVLSPTVQIAAHSSPACGDILIVVRDGLQYIRVWDTWQLFPPPPSSCLQRSLGRARHSLRWDRGMWRANIGLVSKNLATGFQNKIAGGEIEMWTPHWSEPPNRKELNRLPPGKCRLIVLHEPLFLYQPVLTGDKYS